MLFFYNYYYIILGLQAICVIHCLRRNNQQKWIWIIVFLPLIGCIAYIFTEIFTRREIDQVTTGVNSVFNPSGKIRKLESRLQFADTFENKIALADAYLAAGATEKAIALYESSLTGYFTENEYVSAQLIAAYAIMKRYEEIIPIAKRIYKLPQFARSRAHMLYAVALEHTGNKEQAEKEFKMMSSKFAYFEARYNYGLFLYRDNRIDEARSVFTEMLNEKDHLTGFEKRNNFKWFNEAREELRALNRSPA